MNGAHDHYKQPAIWEINSFSSSSTQGKKDGAQTLKQWTPAWKKLQCYLETWLLSSLLPLQISKTFPCCSGVTIGDMSAIHQLRQQTCGRRRVSQDAWFPMQRKSQSALPIWSASFRVERPEKKKCGNPGGLQNVEVLLRNLVASFAAAAAANGFRAYKVFAHAFPREERSRVRNITYTFKNLLGP